jgi:hypothetical protein
MGWRVVVRIYGLALFVLLPFFLVELWPRTLDRNMRSSVILLLVPSTAVVVCSWFQSVAPEVREFIGQRIATRTNVALLLSALVIPVAAERLVRDYRHTQIQSALVEKVLAMTSAENLGSNIGAVRAGVMALMVDENERVFGLSFRGAIDRLNAIEVQLRQRERQENEAKEIALMVQIDSLTDKTQRQEQKLKQTELDKFAIASQIKSLENSQGRDKTKLSALRVADLAAQRQIENQQAALKATLEQLALNQETLKDTEDARNKANAEGIVRKQALDSLLRTSGAAAQQSQAALAEAKTKIEEQEAQIAKLLDSGRADRTENGRLVAALLTSADYLAEIADMYSTGQNATLSIPASDLSHSASSRAVLMYEALTPSPQIETKLSKARLVAERTKPELTAHTL